MYGQDPLVYAAAASTFILCAAGTLYDTLTQPQVAAADACRMVSCDTSPAEHSVHIPRSGLFSRADSPRQSKSLRFSIFFSQILLVISLAQQLFFYQVLLASYFLHSSSDSLRIFKL